MHDRHDHHRMNEDAALSAALRNLPAEAPPHDAWPRIATRVQRRRHLKHAVRIALPAALAAGMALFFVWPHLKSHHTTQPLAQTAHPSTPARSAAEPDSSLTALQASSRQWQAWVTKLDRNGAPLDAQALAQAVALQDHIGLVDLQLSAARNPATAAGLWQQRITLLQQLGLLHLRPYAVTRQARTEAETTFM